MVTRSFWPAALAAALLACGSGGDGGDDGGGGGGGGTPSAGPSSGGGGASTQVGSLLAHAGASDSTSGSNGGWIYATSVSRGEVSLTPTPGSKAKPSWTRPAVALGANPRTLSGTATLPSSSTQLLGDDGATPATSLWVKPSATVTVDAPTGVGTVYVNGPVVIEGTLDAGQDDGGPDAASLLLGGSLVVVAPTGQLLARGEATGAGVRGGYGGAVLLAGATGVFLFGSVDASGGDGGPGGGDGGAVTAGFSPIPLPGSGAGTGGWAVLTGSVDVSGGDAAEGTGGLGGEFVMGLPFQDGGGGEGGFFRATPGAAAARPVLPDDAFAYCSGSVNARGGSGDIGASGGMIMVTGGLSTVVTGPGPLDVSGGSVVTPIEGGAGGTVVVGLWGGEIWAEGTYLLKGGDTGGGTGGQGGSLRVGPAGAGTEVLPSPAVHFTADVDATGGFGDQGGTGGDVTIFTDGDVLAVVDAVDVDAGNGASTGSGGVGGEIRVESTDLDGGYGPVSVDVLLQASGGASDEGMGGLGGSILLYGSAVTCGEARADGGDSSIEFTGADGGAITVWSDDVASTITGPLSVRGGLGGPGDGSHGIVTVDDVVVPLVDGVFVP